MRGSEVAQEKEGAKARIRVGAQHNNGIFVLDQNKTSPFLGVGRRQRWQKGVVRCMLTATKGNLEVVKFCKTYFPMLNQA